MTPDAELPEPADPRQAPLGLDNPNEARVAITDPKVRVMVGRLFGLREALEALRAAKWAQDLAGMKLAQTLLEAEVANAQTEVSRIVLRLCAQAGVDLARLQVQSFEMTDAVICRPWSDAPPRGG